MNFSRKIIYLIIATICSIAIIVSIFYIYTYKNNSNIDDNEFNDLKTLITETTYSPDAIPKNSDYIWGDISEEDDDIIGEIDENKPEQTVPPEPTINEDGDYVVAPPSVSKKPEPKEIIKDFSTLKKLNNDFVGWLSIPGTKLDYPVMQTNNTPDYYLRKNFYGRYSDLGTPYVEEGNNVDSPSDNLTIYGHHVKNGTMFGSLTDYADKKYYDKNKYIKFDTLNYSATYEIISVFKTVVYTNKEDEFKYWKFVDAKTEEEYNAYIDKIKELNLYNIDLTAEYGDKLITLSTCDYSQTNGRLVVVAKMIEKVEK